MLTKNSVHQLKIENLGATGEGIGRIDNFTIFVEGALPGEMVEILILKLKKHYGYGKLLKIIQPSECRVVPICNMAARCGGCALQHMHYKAQLEYKRDRVESCIKRIGGITDTVVEETIGMDSYLHYRNKAQFPIRNINGSPTAGLFAARSHRLIPVKDCLIQHNVNTLILSVIENFMKQYGIDAYSEEGHTGLIRHVLVKVGFSTGEIMVCLIINGKAMPHEKQLIAELAAIEGIKSIVLNYNTKRTNVILGEFSKTIWGKPFIIDHIGDLKFKISPLSFFQVNPIQTDLLYSLVLTLAAPSKTDIIIDAYSGIGTIALFLARQAHKVYGVEIVNEAIIDAEENAKLNNISNVEFIVGKSEDAIPKLLEQTGIKPEIIILDPPRKGCASKLIESIAKAAPNKVVYVSCDPATLARDLKIFYETGMYKIDKVQPVDCFPMTYHVETVVLMSRKDGRKA